MPPSTFLMTTTRPRHRDQDDKDHVTTQRHSHPFALFAGLCFDVSTTPRPPDNTKATRQHHSLPTTPRPPDNMSPTSTTTRRATRPARAATSSCSDAGRSRNRGWSSAPTQTHHILVINTFTAARSLPPPLPSSSSCRRRRRSRRRHLLDIVGV